MADMQRFLTFRQWPRLTAPLARTEVLAGLTVALVMIPQAVAYAGLAGMPFVTGLYTCLIPALLAVLFGSANRLSVGPAALTCVLIGASLTGMAEPGSPEWVALAVWLSLLSGAIQLLLGLDNYGWLTNWPALFGLSSLAANKSVREDDGGRHQLRGVITCIPEHQALIPGSNHTISSINSLIDVG
jgi:SulP family sulfate permease